MGGETESALARTPRFSANEGYDTGQHEMESKESMYIDFIQSKLQN